MAAEGVVPSRPQPLPAPEPQAASEARAVPEAWAAPRPVAAQVASPALPGLLALPLASLAARLALVPELLVAEAEASARLRASAPRSSVPGAAELRAQAEPRSEEPVAQRQLAPEEPRPLRHVPGRTP